MEEGSLADSANALVPDHVVQPGLELEVEIDSEGTLEPGLGVTRRIPETGRLRVDVRAAPAFDLTVIPFILRSNPDTSIVERVEAMESDPEGHELLWDTRSLLPIGDLAVTAHESVMVDTDNAHRLLAETRMIHTMEGASGHYMGTIAGSGFWWRRWGGLLPRQDQFRDSGFIRNRTRAGTQLRSHACAVQHRKRSGPACSPTPTGRSASGGTTSARVAAWFRRTLRI